MDAQEQATLLFDSNPDVVYRTDGEGRFTAITQAADYMLGYTEDEILGRTVFDLVHPDDLERARAGLAESLRRQDREVRAIEVRLVAKDGGMRSFEIHRRLLFDAAGACTGTEGIARDITEHRQAEERLHLFGAIIAASSDAVAIFNRDGCFVESNPAHEKLLGYSADELQGQTIGTWCSAADAERIAGAVEQSGRFLGEVDCHARDGRSLCLEVSVFPVSGDDGEIDCYVGFARDVTQRKREETRRQVLQALREQILLMRGESDIDRVLIALGDTVRQLGIAYQDCGINLLDTSTEPPGMRSRNMRPDGRWNEAGDPRGVRNVHAFWKTGAPVYRRDLDGDDPYGERGYLQTFAHIRSVIDIPFSQGTFVLNHTEPDAFGDEEITLFQEMAQVLSSGFQRIEDLRRLALSEQRYRTLLETPDFVVLLIDASGNYVYVSPKVLDWTGLTPEDFYADREITLRIVHPDEAELATATLERGKAGETLEGVEFRWRARDGSYRWASEGVYPIHSEDGTVHTVQIVVHDITAAKEAVVELERINHELRETQSRLVQSEKMAALGNLVAGIAHEINTPVGAIHSMHDTLMRAVDKLKGTIEDQYPECCAPGSPLARALKVIEDSNRVIETGSERVTNIVRSLRNFARLDEAERKAADLHEGLDDSLMLIHHDTKNRIEVVREYGAIPPVVCYPGRLNQVFLNILNNAQQAIDGTGTITVRTSRVDDEVQVAISDSGAGIPEEHLSRIFDPGFTTKGVGLGTGLGLSICYQIMTDHGGRIDVRSEVGTGSTFTVVIPLTASDKT